MSKWPQTEMQLAEAVVAWLEDLKWEVYQEIQIHYGGEIADIVAVQGPVVWVIETKKTFSLNLIGQCDRWTRYAHYVSAAIPVRKFSVGGNFGYTVCEKFGIGLMEVPEPDGWSRINELLKPKLRRTAMAKEITSCLTEEHKTFAKAGNPDGRRLTPFQITCQRVAKKVKANPGISLKDLIEGLDHHYASSQSARSSISTWVQAGMIEGIKVERDGRFLRFYVEEEKK